MVRVFVGNLDFGASEEALRQLFEDHATVRNVEIPVDWESGHARGFAFVDFEGCTVEKAIRELNGARLNGRQLAVRRAPSVPPVGFDSLSIGEY